MSDLFYVCAWVDFENLTWKGLQIIEKSLEICVCFLTEFDHHEDTVRLTGREGEKMPIPLRWLRCLLAVSSSWFWNCIVKNIKLLTKRYLKLGFIGLLNTDLAYIYSPSPPELSIYLFSVSSRTHKEGELDFKNGSVNLVIVATSETWLLTILSVE